MCAAIKSDIDKKRNKTKSVLGYCNGLLSRIIPSNSKSMLKVDAVPMANGAQQNTSNELIRSNGSIQEHPSSVTNGNTQLALTPPMQLVQNNVNQANQNLTVIESQQNLHFNNIHGLQIGNTFHVSSSRPRKNSNENGEDKMNQKKTKATVELMNCMDAIGTQIMKIAARYIGKDWRMVFRDLDIPDAEIAQIKEQYFHISVEEVIYQLLLRWERNSDDPSLGRLTTVLWKNNEHECVTELKKYYKKHKRALNNNVTDKSDKEPNGKGIDDNEAD